jgi:hypothetical protein
MGEASAPSFAICEAQSFTSARAAGSWGGLFLCREFCREVQSKKANLRFGYTIRLE